METVRGATCEPQAIWGWKTIRHQPAGLDELAGLLGLTDAARILLECDGEEHLISLAVLRTWADRFATCAGWSVERLEEDSRATKGQGFVAVVQQRHLNSLRARHDRFAFGAGGGEPHGILQLVIRSINSWSSCFLDRPLWNPSKGNRVPTFALRRRFGPPGRGQRRRYRVAAREPMIFTLDGEPIAELHHAAERPCYPLGHVISPRCGAITEESTCRSTRGAHVTGRWREAPGPARGGGPSGLFLSFHST